MVSVAGGDKYGMGDLEPDLGMGKKIGDVDDISGRGGQI